MNLMFYLSESLDMGYCSRFLKIGINKSHIVILYASLPDLLIHTFNLCSGIWIGQGFFMIISFLHSLVPPLDLPQYEMCFKAIPMFVLHLIPTHGIKLCFL